MNSTERFRMSPELRKFCNELIKKDGLSKKWLADWLYDWYWQIRLEQETEEWKEKQITDLRKLYNKIAPLRDGLLAIKSNLFSKTFLTAIEEISESVFGRRNLFLEIEVMPEKFGLEIHQHKSFEKWLQYLRSLGFFKTKKGIPKKSKVEDEFLSETSKFFKLIGIREFNMKAQRLFDLLINKPNDIKDSYDKTLKAQRIYKRIQRINAT